MSKPIEPPLHDRDVCGIAEYAIDLCPACKVEGKAAVMARWYPIPEKKKPQPKMNNLTASDIEAANKMLQNG